VFRKKMSPLDLGLVALRDRIRGRGETEIDEINEATLFVDQYLNSVLAEAGASGNDLAKAWAADRLRLFIVVGPTPKWVETIEELPDFHEASELVAEYNALVRQPERFAAPHLVAWWWHLDPTLFRPSIDLQFSQMREALVGGVANGLHGNVDFTAHMFDWSSLFSR
jgi:hypothetical protein